MTRDILRQTLGSYHLDNVSKEGAGINKDGTAGTSDGKRRDETSRENEEVENETRDGGVKNISSFKEQTSEFCRRSSARASNWKWRWSGIFCKKRAWGFFQRLPQNIGKFEPCELLR